MEYDIISNQGSSLSYGSATLNIHQYIAKGEGKLDNYLNLWPILQ